MARAKPIDGLSATMPFRDAAAVALRARAAELFAQLDRLDAALAAGDEAARVDGVHDVRVAARRLRAVLEATRPCFPKKRCKRLIEEVKRIAEGLGASRDLDVALERVAGYRVRAERSAQTGIDAFAQQLQAERDAARATTQETIESLDRRALERRVTALIGAKQ